MVQQAVHTPGTIFFLYRVWIDPPVTPIMDDQLFFSAAQQ
jgi:hypothetical protein